MGIGRGAAPRTRTAFAQLCGVALALGAIATAFDRAYAANVDLSEIFDILDADRDGVVGRQNSCARRPRSSTARSRIWMATSA